MPYSKRQSLTAVPAGLTLPLNLADVWLIDEELPVSTTGGLEPGGVDG